MSDIDILEQEQDELENKPKFEHYVQATGELVEEFRDVLAAHTAEMDQKAIASGGKTSPEHIAEAAQLHRLRTACDNFINALAGNY